jgi:HPt (histidine-containing phosphotransfer) domain-containing protein
MELNMTTFEELKEATGGDFIDELVDTYLEDAPRQLSALHAALQTQDAEAFRRAAHSLKSNSATFGAGRLSEMAKELELLAKDNKLAEAGPKLPAVEEAFRAAEAELKGLRQ